MPSTNDVWKRNATARIQGEEITLPSGQTCIARKLDIEELLTTGFLNQIDAFTSLVDVDVVAPAKAKLQGRKPSQKSLAQRAAEKEKATEATLMSKLATDPTLITSMADMLNRLTPRIVVEPRVLCHMDDEGTTIPADARDEDAVYTDQVDFMDKMELFTFAIGNVGDLAPFREKAARDVAGVADGGDVPLPAVGNPGSA